VEAGHSPCPEAVRHSHAEVTLDSCSQDIEAVPGHSSEALAALRSALEVDVGVRAALHVVAYYSAGNHDKAAACHILAADLLAADLHGSLGAEDHGRARALSAEPGLWTNSHMGRSARRSSQHTGYAQLHAAAEKAVLSMQAPWSLPSIAETVARGGRGGRTVRKGG
jgi:hypothetical protein